MIATNTRIAIAALFCTALTACSGANNSGPSTPRAAPDTVSVTVRIAVPRSPSNVKKKPNFVSPATQSVAVTVRGAGPPTGVTVVGNCAQGFCSQTVSAPIGSDEFSVSLYSQPNATGSVLSSGSTTSQILAGANNVVSITFDPVVQSASANVATPLGAGQATSVPVAIVPLDPSGATIVGPGTFENANGVPVSVSISLDDPTGHAKLVGPTSFASPPPNGAYPVTLADDGTPPNFNYPSLVASVAGAVSSTTTVTLAPLQSGTPVSVPGGNVQVMAKGPDGNVWFVAGTGQSFSIGQYVIATGAIHLFALPSGVIPSDLVTGGDGNLWFFDTARTTFGQITTGGLLRQFAAAFAATDLVEGVDGNIWFLTSQAAAPLGKITTNGSISTYAAGPSTMLYGITPSKNHRMYFLASVSAGLELGSVNADGSGLTYVATTLENDGPLGYSDLYAGGDGNFYTVEPVGFGDALLQRITLSGSVSTSCGQYEYQSVGSVLADGTLIFDGNVNDGDDVALGAIRPSGACVFVAVSGSLDNTNIKYPVVGIATGYFYAYLPASQAIARFAY
jgi:streptogramin lyase